MYMYVTSLLIISSIKLCTLFSLNLKCCFRYYMIFCLLGDQLMLQGPKFCNEIQSLLSNCTLQCRVICLFWQLITFYIICAIIFICFKIDYTGTIRPSNLWKYFIIFIFHDLICIAVYVTRQHCRYTAITYHDVTNTVTHNHIKQLRQVVTLLEVSKKLKQVSALAKIHLHELTVK